MVQTTSVVLMMLDFTMIELTIPTRMPRFYEEEKEEKEEEGEGKGVRHWRLFLVAIVCSSTTLSLAELRESTNPWLTPLASADLFAYCLSKNQFYIEIILILSLSSLA